MFKWVLLSYRYLETTDFFGRNDKVAYEYVLCLYPRFHVD